jgi:hypothetical protein
VGYLSFRHVNHCDATSIFFRRIPSGSKRDPLDCIDQLGDDCNGYDSPASLRDDTHRLVVLSTPLRVGIIVGSVTILVLFHNSVLLLFERLVGDSYPFYEREAS